MSCGTISLGALQVSCSILIILFNYLKLPRFMCLAYPDRVNRLASLLMLRGADGQDSSSSKDDETVAPCHFLSAANYGVSGAIASIVCLSSLCRLTKVVTISAPNRRDCSKKELAAMLTLCLAISSLQIVLVTYSPPEGFIFYNGCVDPNGHSEIRGGVALTLRDISDHEAPWFIIYKVMTLFLQTVAVSITILTAIVIRKQA